MMPEVRWKVSFLFILLTLSIFASIYLSGDSISEGIRSASGNDTLILIGNNTSKENSIGDLINQLVTGSHETRLNTADKLGKLGKPAADILIENIESLFSFIEETGRILKEDICSRPRIHSARKTARKGFG